MSITSKKLKTEVKSPVNSCSQPFDFDGEFSHRLILLIPFVMNSSSPVIRDISLAVILLLIFQNVKKFKNHKSIPVCFRPDSDWS